MGVPKRVAGKISAAVPVPHDLVPHEPARVNTYCSPPGLDGSDELLDVLAVGFRSPLIPRAARTGIRLDV